MMKNLIFDLENGDRLIHKFDLYASKWGKEQINPKVPINTIIQYGRGQQCFSDLIKFETTL